MTSNGCTSSNLVRGTNYSDKLGVVAATLSKTDTAATGGKQSKETNYGVTYTGKYSTTMTHGKLRAVSSWVTDSQNEICFEDEFLECRLVILKIVRYMKDNHLTQKELAEKLGVSPQYINKFLHGCDMNMKLSTILRYGRLLGIKLLEVPEDNCFRWKKDLDYYSPRIEIRLTLPSLTIIITNINMSQIKIYHIIKTIAKTSVMSGDYKSCLNYFKEQDKVFRKTHKIISAEDYQKILKKKPI